MRRQGYQAFGTEARLRPGGRVRTIRERFALGFYGEAGAEAIPQSHDITQHYARQHQRARVGSTTSGRPWMSEING
ncbi:MAG TPA: FAD-dependent oxidoreductase [Bryobacteraceae bacterium]|nr:FAD-dependent oxidoreductase [Bryobacteraceae bacterium]